MDQDSNTHGSAIDAPRLIDARIAELGDWRGETLARVRAAIHAADPEVVEEWKWRGVPVWSHAGIVCTGETYKSAVKLTFAKGGRTGRPGRAVQRQPGGQHPPRHRHPSGGPP